MRYLFASLMIVMAITFYFPIVSNAQSADDIRKAISEHNQQIDQLNKDIAQFQAELDTTSAKKQTLQGTLKVLDLSIKKINSSVNLTKNQIGSTQLQIQQLQSGISNRQSAIDANESGLAQSLRLMDQAESEPLASQILTSDSISQTWQEVDNFQSLQIAVKERIHALSKEKQDLTENKMTQESKKKDLEHQKANLVTQQGSLTVTKKVQGDLLVQTKSKESTYQQIIAEKKAQEKSFESALNDLQARLNVAVNQSDITPSGKGIIHWPVEKVRVTQYFGNTAFAASGAYNGKGHNGIDLAVSIGSPIKAALSGTVIGTGNTDAVRGCYSFGKWVMVKHGNGLNTMYSHLSQINVSSGQEVETGEVLGYSGDTGYATGPHLHFGVYVSAATQIIKLGEATKSTTPCANATMPVTPLAGYLNPLNYL